MRELLIGSRNPGKIALYRKFTSHLPLHSTTLDEAGIDQDAPEDGKTFSENSRSKAEFYHGLTGMMTIADDGGLEIDALNGAPGVLSRRWPGYEASDSELIEFALSKLQGIPFPRRKASLGGVMTLVTEDGDVHQVPIAIQGIISENLDRPIPKGFPFRALFWIPELNKYYVDLSDDELEALDHRKVGIHMLEKYLT